MLQGQSASNWTKGQQVTGPRRVAVAGQRTVGHKTLGLRASNWKPPCAFVFPTEFNPGCMWNSLANFKLDKLVSRKPASEKT